MRFNPVFEQPISVAIITEFLYTFAPVNRFWTFLVLLAHINFGMCIPHVDEVDQFDVHQSRLDDINSLYEYINETVLGNIDPSPDDEDDDKENVYNISKIDQYAFNARFFMPKQPEYLIRKSMFPPSVQEKLPFATAEVTIPPPKV